MQTITRRRANIPAQTFFTLLIAVVLLSAACSNDSEPQQGSFEVKNTDVSRIELEPTRKSSEINQKVQETEKATPDD